MGTKSDCAERAMADNRTIVSGAEAALCPEACE
jgi:hypothetical protein